MTVLAGPSTLVTIQLFCLAAFTLYLIGLSVYRLTFHKLSKHPGPWLNAISEIPLSLALMSGRQHVYFRMLHAKYGPVVRTAPHDLSFCSGTAWEDIYGTKNNLAKAPVVTGALRSKTGTVAMSVAPTEAHSRMRKAWAYPFSNTALLQQESLVTKHIDKLMEQLRRLASSPTDDDDESQGAGGQAVDLRSWFKYVTFDIVGELAFAEPFGCLDLGCQTKWSTSVSRVGEAVVLEQPTRRLLGHGKLQQLLLWYLVPRDAMKWRYTHLANSKKKTLERLADQEREHRDFLYYILKNGEAKRASTVDEIVMNSSLIVAAGSETTAVMLSGWANLMLRNGAAYEKLAREIRTSFESESDIIWSSVKDLPYLAACISESMRLFPPFPINLVRVTSADGCLINNKWIPENTNVSVSPWAASYSPMNFKDPEKFIPERWLDVDIGRGPYQLDNRAASQPFSLGPRGCLGRNLSHLEQKLIISRILWNFDVEFQGGERAAWQWDPTHDFQNLQASLSWISPPLLVRLKSVRA